MKITKIVCTLAVATVCVFVATGCGGHKPGKLTTLPGHTPLPPPEIANTQTLNNNEQAVPQPNPTDFYNGMKMDRAALAANTVHFAYDSAAIKKAERPNLE